MNPLSTMEATDRADSCLAGGDFRIASYAILGISTSKSLQLGYLSLFRHLKRKLQLGVSKNRQKTPKMDGENNGNPYYLMDDLGGPPLFLETPN